MQVLPWPGGLLEQPHFVFQGIERCEATWRELQSEKAEEDRKELEGKLEKLGRR